MSLHGLRIRVIPDMTPGTALLLGRSWVCVRHLADLTPGLLSAPWHTSSQRCPTWTDAAECRCMTEGQ